MEHTVLACELELLRLETCLSGNPLGSAVEADYYGVTLDFH